MSESQDLTFLLYKMGLINVYLPQGPIPGPGQASTAAWVQTAPLFLI